MGKPFFLAFFLCILVHSFRIFAGNPEQSLSKISTQIRTIPDKEFAESLLNQSRKIEKNNPLQSEILSKKVLAFAMAENMKVLKIQAQLQIANILVTRTKYAEAMKIALQVREAAEKLHAEKELAGYFEIVGRIRTSTGDFNESLENLFIALQYSDKLKDMTGVCRAQNAIGGIYYRQQNYANAKTYVIKALAISILIRDTVLQARSLNNMGAIMLARKDYANAMIYFSYAMLLNQKTGQIASVGENLVNQGIVLTGLGKHEESMQNFNKAIAIFSQFENYSQLALCYLNIAYSFKEKGDRDTSIRSFQKTYKLAEKYGFKGVELEAVSRLQDLFQEASMIDSAYAYSILKEKLKESVEKEKSSTKSSIAELQYQYEKKDSDQKSKQQWKDFITAVIVLALIALIGFSYLLVSRQRQKTKAIVLEKKAIELERKNLSDELDFKNKELTLSVMNLLKRNEFIIKTSRRLLNLKSDSQPEVMKDEVVKIARSLQDETKRETWEEFELRFKEVHSGFYDRLLAKYPGLTSNELRMCGLLSLNLTTKEISELTGQRSETIEKARFRLRKHLGLDDPKVNLVTFLTKI